MTIRLLSRLDDQIGITQDTKRRDGVLHKNASLPGHKDVTPPTASGRGLQPLEELTPKMGFNRITGVLLRDHAV